MNGGERGRAASGHFSDEEWADYVRGVVDAEIRWAMDRHLAGQCAHCQRVCDVLAQFSRFSLNEPAYMPPADTVRIAEAAFAAHARERVSLPRLVARLMYDSFREPLPAGMRAQDRLARQALYQAGDYYLDLRVEHEPGSALVSLVGQVVNRKDPEASIGNVAVVLTAQREVIARTVSDRFGEFQLQYRPAPRMRLFVPVFPQGRRIEVSLSRLTGSVAAVASRPAPVLRYLGRKPAKDPRRP